MESDGHPIIGHYVIGALVIKQTMSCEVAPTYVMTIIVRPLTGSPPCASLRSPARAARSAHLRMPPLGAGALC